MTLIPDADTHTPTSTPASESVVRRRAAYGAPEAPVIPRKTFIAARRAGLAPAFGALGLFEERSQLLVLLVREVRERRHRRAGVDATGALQVVDLELNPAVLRPFRAEVGSAEVGSSGSQIGVAAEAARLRE